ncbi:DNA ligase [Vreelandella rituensis]|uniref:DNA ligase (NAD(+)) n=1 Tax=Vreelandella rituensis TaxID=2282306 RepID=A0A368UA39_9GAMM|nr:DNA ligase [Halomonas rituensis]RCV93885.1 DNA ligase [Halomonas rituensis]
MTAKLSILPNADLIADNEVALALLDRSDSLADVCRELNAAYRSGAPIVSDVIYDQVFLAALRRENADHPFLHEVEPEPLALNAPTVRHATPMLSTQKCYTHEEVARFIQQVQRAAQEQGIDPTSLRFRLTPKLDGIAAEDGGKQVVTRGDGLQGQDITRIVERGVAMLGGRGLGRGELVACKTFFDAHLGRDTEHELDHARNFIAGFVGADTLKPHHHLALKEGAIRFVPFAILGDRTVTADELLSDWQGLYDAVIADNQYETDGMVVEVAHAALREAMGATSHHERAVMAIKKQGETAISTVEGIRLTTGRTGRIIPTLEISPVYLSGANVSKATAHTAKNLIALGLGEGAEILVTRSGSVIPKLLNVITPSPNPLIITHCPVCETEAIEEGEHLVCSNTAGCSSQTEARLRHWFHTLGNVDLFGPKAITKLVDAGIETLPEIYAMQTEDFEAVGFGPGQSANLVGQLARSLNEPVMEWRWLAAFGIRHLGKGDARKLLAEIPLAELEHVTPEQINAIAGFGALTSPAIAASLHEIWPTIAHMHSLGFTLEADAPVSASTEAGPLAAEKIVFTGTMQVGSRKVMESEAAALGAEIQSAVNAKTTMLVIGEKAGSKLAKAEKINEKAGRVVVRVLTEAEYLALIAG